MLTKKSIASMTISPQRIHRINEKDFDGVILRAGGEKIDTGEESEGVKSADYKLGSNVIELKLLEEEGLDKPERQSKIAELFTEQFPDFPVVVIDPYLLRSDDRRQRLNRILESPIKGLVKKASKQLKSSCEKHTAKGRILVILNNGYMSLRHEDIKHLVLKCVRNDTSNIDLVIVGGLYYEYDGFESYVLGYFEPFPIDLSKEIDTSSLAEEWNNLLTKIMNDFILDSDPDSTARNPNQDIAFEVGGKLFVRPRSQVGKPSSFFIHGRPRENSTGLETCPPVATAIPEVTEDDWTALRELLSDGELLPGTFRRWKEIQLERIDPEDPVLPIVAFRPSVSDFRMKTTLNSSNKTFKDFLNYTANCFSEVCSRICEDAIELPSEIEIGGRFILVGTIEIGSDKAFDFSSIYLITDIPGFERREALVKNSRIFFEHALALGATYAIRHGCNRVFWVKNTEFGWT